MLTKKPAPSSTASRRSAKPACRSTRSRSSTARTGCRAASSRRSRTPASRMRSSAARRSSNGARSRTCSRTLRVLVNPLDDVSMARIVNVPPRGSARPASRSCARSRSSKACRCARPWARRRCNTEFGAKARKGLAELARVLETAQRAAGDGAHGPLKLILTGTNYLQHATGYGDAEDSTREGEHRRTRQRHRAASTKPRWRARRRRHTAAGRARGLYLQHVALLTSADTQGKGRPCA